MFTSSKSIELHVHCVKAQDEVFYIVYVVGAGLILIQVICNRKHEYSK
jgi:hypothetical protein